MKIACPTCQKVYDVPAQSIHNAGQSGMKIRCHKCQSLMRASYKNLPNQEPQLNQGLRDNLQGLSMSAAGAFAPNITNVHDAVVPESAPAIMSETGTFRPRPGVVPEVTDVHFSLNNKNEERIWYACIDNMAKGPFTEDEVLLLAEMGRVRGSTVMWRPGFKEWLPIRTGGTEHQALNVFRNTVISRKIYEQSLLESAAARAGVNVRYLNEGHHKNISTAHITDNTPNRLVRFGLYALGALLLSMGLGFAIAFSVANG